MAAYDEAPCRVSADLRRYQAEMDRLQPRVPDFADTDDLHDLVPDRIVKSLAHVFHTRDQVRLAKSIGGLNHEKACESLMQALSNLEEDLRILESEW